AGPPRASVLELGEEEEEPALAGSEVCFQLQYLGFQYVDRQVSIVGNWHNFRFDQHRAHGHNGKDACDRDALASVGCVSRLRRRTVSGDHPSNGSDNKQPSSVDEPPPPSVGAA